ncbi:MAG: YceI family protein [Balneolaceae bacterium]
MEVESLILEGSKLRINGTSNVNDFECIYDDRFETDTLKHIVQVEEAIVVLDGDQLKLEIDSFDCGKRGINRDFRNTLKSKVYPNIQIELVKVVAQNEVPFEAEIMASLAGVTNRYILELVNLSIENEQTQFEGTLTLKMSDFNLSPPTALFGLIKVRDEIDVNFLLKIRQ